MTVEVFPIGHSGLKCVLIQSDAPHANNLFEVTLIKNGKVLEENGIEAHLDFDNENQFLTFRSGVEQLDFDLVLKGLSATESASLQALLIQSLIKKEILDLPVAQTQKVSSEKNKPQDELTERNTSNPFAIFNRPAESVEEQNQLENTQKNETKKPNSKISRHGF